MVAILPGIAGYFPCAFSAFALPVSSGIIRFDMLDFVVCGEDFSPLRRRFLGQAFLPQVQAG
ncbi:MAG TPA: hypothetical protein PLD30_08265 [Candidatus Competibacteraceae bacterium]|nr:hypothetical protein [Candidatus Competibacteraceae bacterium]